MCPKLRRVAEVAGRSNPVDFSDKVVSKVNGHKRAETTHMREPTHAEPGTLEQQHKRLEDRVEE